MKILYTSDLHGEISLYQELLALAESSCSEAMAIGGDLLPSFPPTGRYEGIIANQRRFIEHFLYGFLKKVLKTSAIRRIFLIAGNWDLGYEYLFSQSTESIIDLNRKSYRLENGYELVGYPFVPPTPFRPKDFEKMDDRESPWPPQKDPSYIFSSEPGNSGSLSFPQYPSAFLGFPRLPSASPRGERQEASPERRAPRSGRPIPVDAHLYLRGRETIEEDLERLSKPLQEKRTIYIMHSPPFGTRLDLIEGGESAGSRSIRGFIERRQPRLTLHGHIHESPRLSGAYIDRIGETISINPGQFVWTKKNVPKLHAVQFEIERIEQTLTHTCFPSQRGSSPLP